MSSWEDFDLNINLLRGIYSYGFEKPSPIQEKGITPIINNKDMIAQAQSGTGKTGCFCIGSLNKIDLNLNKTQILVLAPTRELAKQIKDVYDKISIYMKNIKIDLLIGGSYIDNNDIINFKNDPPHIIIGCPGRIYDIINRNYLEIDSLKLTILDEADELLSDYFIEQIYNIFKYFNNNIQICLFTATLNNNLFKLTKEFLNDPINITVQKELLTLDGIKQYYVFNNYENDKYEILKKIYYKILVSQSIIYCNSINKVNELYNIMTNDGFSVCELHGNLDKNMREKNYNDFIRGNKRVLISSDITARGIDIQQVSTVINYEVPKSKHTYLHRIGRSGRWGRKGLSINLITKKDIGILKNIEDFYSTEIKELAMDFELDI